MYALSERASNSVNVHYTQHNKDTHTTHTLLTHYTHTTHTLHTHYTHTTHTLLQTTRNMCNTSSQSYIGFGRVSRVCVVVPSAFSRVFCARSAHTPAGVAKAKLARAEMARWQRAEVAKAEVTKVEVAKAEMAKGGGNEGRGDKER